MTALPIVLDTDIGTDIDDAYALLLAASSPELDLRAVVTVNNDVLLRARIAVSLLRSLGRGDVPVIAGASASLTAGVSLGWGGHEGEGIDVSGIRDSDVVASSEYVARMRSVIDACHAAGTPPILVPIGALTNIAVLLESLSADTIGHIGGIVAMGSTFEGFGEDCAQPEHNIACDPVAAESVLASGVPTTFVGLNVTRQTSMTASQVDKIEAIGGPLSRDLVGMHRVWFERIRSDRSPMHDGLAVAAAFRADTIETIPVSARSMRECGAPGAIVFDRPEPGRLPTVCVATSVDVGRYHALLWDRVSAAARASGERFGGV